MLLSSSLFLFLSFLFFQHHTHAGNQGSFFAMVHNAVTASAVIYAIHFFTGAVSFVTTFFFHISSSSLLKSSYILWSNFSMTFQTFYLISLLITLQRHQDFSISALTVTEHHIQRPNALFRIILGHCALYCSFCGGVFQNAFQL